MAPEQQRNVRHRAEQLAAPLPPLLVAAERVASTVAQGVHGRRRVGQGETFWQFRRYEFGDPAQLIDWRQSAKSQNLFVREHEWEAAQSVWLWRDCSASMSYRSERTLPEKIRRAELLLLALMALLIRAGEHITLLGSGLTPSTGRATFHRLAGLVARQDGSQAGADLPVFEVLPRYAQLVLIGDFLSPAEDIHACIGRFAARGCRGHLLQILDPAEVTLPFRGRVRFAGLEDEAEIATLGRVESVRGEYRSRLRTHRDQVAALARAVGWGYSSHRTDRPPQAPLLGLYMALDQRLRR
ncbi:MAG: DUF58 domain-containing protein [Kiloniellales bacterium]